MKDVRAIALFSGGLDSILATRLIMNQGVDVIAVQFVTPFFNYDILHDVQGYQQKIFEKYGIQVRVVDISAGYMNLLRKPTYGFGKNFNPCVDCKIFMMQHAKELMLELGASFLVTGEVLGQRPMSQRRDTLNVIARDSDSKAMLLRPLSAKLMKETEAELKGWVDREQLLDFSGRGRSRQIALAKEYGITDYPPPAGGCVLADPILSKRIKRLYQGEFAFSVDEVGVADIELMLVGRQMLVPFSKKADAQDFSVGAWLVIGRDEVENGRLEGLAEEGDALLFMEERPGPAVLLRRAASSIPDSALPRLLEIAASLVVRYGRKIDGGYPEVEVICSMNGEQKKIISGPPADESYADWLF